MPEGAAQESPEAENLEGAAREPDSPFQRALQPDTADPEGRAAPKRRWLRGSLFEVVLVVLLALFLALFSKVYVVEAYEIRGRSMETTFSEGQRVMVLKILYSIHRGDIIIFCTARNPQKDLIKRVIGTPGDIVEIKRGRVFVNGEELEESYAQPTSRPVYRKWELGDGEYFVLGDNRPDSQDSRVFQAIKDTTIKGKVVLRWWPLEDIHTF